MFLKTYLFKNCVFSSGHLDVVCLLVSQGAELSYKDKRGYTPFHAAASNGQIAVVKHLLSLSVEVQEYTYITNWWGFFGESEWNAHIKSRHIYYNKEEELWSAHSENRPNYDFHRKISLSIVRK